MTLDAHNSSLNHLGDDLDLIIRFSGNFKTSLEGDQEGELTLEQQIKDEFNSDDEFSVMVSNLEALLQSFGLNQNTHWNFYAKGKVLDSDGLEETVYQQLSFRDDQDKFELTTDPDLISDLDQKEYVSNSIDSTYLNVNEVENEFTWNS